MFQISSFVVVANYKLRLTSLFPKNEWVFLIQSHLATLLAPFTATFLKILAKYLNISRSASKVELYGTFIFSPMPKDIVKSPRISPNSAKIICLNLPNGAQSRKEKQKNFACKSSFMSFRFSSYGNHFFYSVCVLSHISQIIWITF